MLGDRVAILIKGVIKAYGTPFNLKRQINIGQLLFLARDVSSGTALYKKTATRQLIISLNRESKHRHCYIFRSKTCILSSFASWPRWRAGYANAMHYIMNFFNHTFFKTNEGI
jgi:ABC-type multidrug transport system ATPase subunit